jgi:hypothetical protein
MLLLLLLLLLLLPSPPTDGRRPIVFWSQTFLELFVLFWATSIKSQIVWLVVDEPFISIERVAQNRQPPLLTELIF